jgi:hypothetical protein
MDKRKYAQYVTPIRRGKEFEDLAWEGKISVPPSRWDKKCFPATTHWIEFFYIYAPGGGMGLPSTLGLKIDGKPHPSKGTGGMTHPFDEFVMFFGTDPANPDALGGEVEYWLGEGKEAEKYIIDKPTCIFVPAGVVHCPLLVTKVEKPFINLVIADTPDYSLIREPGECEVSPDFLPDFKKRFKVA